MLDRGAQPMFRQAPATRAECEALEIARQRATGELPQPRDEWGNGSRNGRAGNRSRSGTGIGTSIVNDGSGHYAQVHWEGSAPRSYCYIRQPSGKPGDIHGNDVKGWDGIPQWEGTSMAKPGHIDIHAPAPTVHRVYEDHIIVRQRRFFHENAEDEHIDGAPQQAAQIHMQASTVEAHYSDQVQVHDHRPPQSLLSAIFFGVRKPKQQKVPEADRGALLAASQQPLALSHQPAMPMPMETTKKSWSRT